MKKIALMMLIAIAAIACETTPEVVPELEVSTTELTVPVEGTEDFVVEFTASMDWTAKIKGDAEWLSISPAKGVAGEGKITVIADPNPVEEERTATVEITMGGKTFEVVLTQEALFVPRFAIESSLLIPTAGGDVDFAVATNLDYEVTVAENDWLEFSKAADKVTFTAKENTALDARSVTATFTTEYSEFGGTLTITQDGLCRTLWAVNMTEVMNRPAQAPTSSTDEKPTAVSIAVYGDNVVVSAGDGSEPVLLDKATGEKKGTIATGDFKPYTVRQDDAGNLVMTNRVWAKWNKIENSFAIAYLTPNSSDLVTLINTGDNDPDGGLREEYLGVNMNVRGDVTEKALIGMVHQNGDYPHNVISFFDVNDGVAIKYNVTMNGFKGVGWAGGCFGTWPHNIPGLGLTGASMNDPAVICAYESNILQSLDPTTGICTDLSDSMVPYPDSNYAPTSIDVRNIGGKPYAAVAFTSFYAHPVYVMIIDATTQEVVYTWNDAVKFEETVAEQTNYDYMSCSVVLAEAEGGMIAYVADKTTAVIAAKYFAL